jgi:hypothetical protein
MFIIAHEVAHHLLGHTRKGKRNRDPSILANRAIRDADMWDRFHSVSSSKREELQADALAFLLVADSVEKLPSTLNISVASMASSIVLLSLAHIGGEWEDKDTTATHPDFLLRYDLMAALTQLLSKGRPADPHEEHPLHLLAEITVFTGHAYFISHRESSPQGVKPNIDVAAQAFLNILEQIDADIPR